MFTRAVSRKPGPDFWKGITTANLGKPDFDLMQAQHSAYVAALEDAGLSVQVLDPLPGFPDAYFVEDVAVMTPKTAVLTRPGAAARQGEVAEIMDVLSRFRSISRIEPPGLLEGGDVLAAGQHVFIGLSERTNEHGAAQLGRILESQGFTCSTVPVAAGLHFKSSVNYVGKNTLLVSRAFAGRPELAGYDEIILEKAEAYAANTLLVNGRLLTPKGFPSVKVKLAALGMPIIELDVSEAQKMDGGLTCMSLRF